MTGDFANAIFDPVKRFMRVLLQQGPVVLDADIRGRRGRKEESPNAAAASPEAAARATPRFTSATDVGLSVDGLGAPAPIKRRPAQTNRSHRS